MSYSVRYETNATIEIDGDETDVRVRAAMRLEPGTGVGGGWGATRDGDIEAMVGGTWVDVDMLGVDERMVEQLEEAFAEIAFGDDGGADEADYRDE